MSKRFLLCVLVLVGIIVPISVNAQDDVVELSFWTEWSGEPERPALEAMLEQFNEAYPNIRVVHRPIENEQFFTVLRTAFTSGNPPDIFQHEANNNLFQFVIPGEVEDISDWYTANADRFLPGSENAIMYDGKYYGIPLNIHTTTQIYYNVTVLTEHGIDPDALKTWDDYLAAFETLKQAGVTPIAFGNKFGWPGSQWFFSFLVRWVGAEKVNQLVARNCGYSWTDPDVVEAAQLYVDLAQKGYFSSGMASDDYPVATATFFAGRAGFFHSGSWFIADTGAPPEFELGMNEFPIIEGGHGDPDQAVAGVLGGLAITKKGAETEARREAALTFVDWFTQLEQAQYWAEQTSSISTIQGALTEETADPLILQIIDEQIKDNTGTIAFLEHVTPKLVGEDRIWMGGVGVLTGQLDAQEWMASVEEAAAAEDPTLVIEPVCEE